MELDCDHYLLSQTAMEIWRTGDDAGQARMFECLSRTHKASFFKRVIFQQGKISDEQLNDLAESAFLNTWTSFNDHGRAGKLLFTHLQYTGYFFTAFKRQFLKLLSNELRRQMVEKEFIDTQKDSSPLELPILNAEEGFSRKIQMALEKMSPECRELLIWRHVEGLSHDEIARRRGIERTSSIKMLSRCTHRFIKIWQTI